MSSHHSSQHHHHSLEQEIEPEQQQEQIQEQFENDDHHHHQEIHDDHDVDQQQNFNNVEEPQSPNPVEIQNNQEAQSLNSQPRQLRSQNQSPDKRNLFENLEESPFKNQEKDYGEKYNKVIDKLRDSTSLNDLARKYNKLHLPIQPKEQAPETLSNQKFVFDSDSKLLELNNNSFRMSFENNHQLIQPQRNSHNNSFQTPLKTEHSQRSQIHKKLDSIDMRNSILSRRTQDSAIPNILAQIQNNQKKYKSPSNQVKANFDQFFSNPSDFSRLTYQSLLQNNKYKKFRKGSDNDVSVRGSQQLNTSKQNISNDKISLGEHSPDLNASRSVKQLRKNFKNFLLDINLGYNSKTGVNRTIVSPKAFVRSSPTRKLAPSNATSNGTSSQSNLQGSSGLDDLISKIQKKKARVISGRESSPSTITSSKRNLSQIGTAFSYHPQHTGQLHKFEQDLDSMRLNSLFTLNSTKRSTHDTSFKGISIHSKLRK